MMLPFNGRYEMLSDCPGGGMGDVAICWDKNLSRKVVVKSLKVGQEHRRLLDERKALLKLRSRHVVQLHDLVDLSDGGSLPAIVLEHIEGDDLFPGQFSNFQEHLFAIWQIACGLMAIHAENLIHRDIKHNNIRLNRDGVIKILDFGLARTKDVDAYTVSKIGTPGFMAPELWKNQDVSFDQSIDVYAFAATAILLYHGDLPNELLSYPPSPIASGILSAIFINHPDDIIELFEAALSHDPLARPMIAEIELATRRHLLKGRHRGLLVLGKDIHEVNSASPNVTVTSKDRGALGIYYDGLRFTASGISGNVLVNNLPIWIGDELPACCVITFGLEPNRKFVTFDVSNPEVMP